MKNWLKLLFFVFGYAASILIALPTMGWTDEEPGEVRKAVLMTLLYLIGVGIMIVIFKLVYRRIFPASRRFCFKLPGRRLAAGILMVYPFLAFMKMAVKLIGEHPEYLWALDTDVDISQLWSLLMELPYVALLAPVFDELCCRVFPISSYETRRGRITAGVITMALFSLLHISNWLTVVPDAILFSVVYIATGNMAISMLMHIANNLAAMLIPSLIIIYCLCFPDASLGIAVTPLPLVILFVAAFAVGLVLIVKEIRKAVFSRKKAPDGGTV